MTAMKFFQRLCLAALLAAPVAGAAVPAFAQNAADEASFDYDPGQAAAPQPARRQASRMDFSDVEVVKLPQGGATFVYKHRWKDWLERVVYVCLAAVALLAITASVGKADEQSLMLAYFLEGVNFMMAQWALVCSLTLVKLRSAYGYYTLPAGLVLTGATYFLLMRIRAADVSQAEVRDSFLRPAEASGSDIRLSSVDGTPGDWPDRDIDR